MKLRQWIAAKHEYIVTSVLSLEGIATTFEIKLFLRNQRPCIFHRTIFKVQYRRSYEKNVSNFWFNSLLLFTHFDFHPSSYENFSNCGMKVPSVAARSEIQT